MTAKIDKLVEKVAELYVLTGQSRHHCHLALQLYDGDMKKAEGRLKMQHLAPFTVEQEVALRIIVCDELTKFATTLMKAQDVRKN